MTAAGGKRDRELGTLSGRKEALKADTTVLSITASRAGGVASPATGACGGVEVELTDIGERGARRPRSGVSERDARDMLAGWQAGRTARWARRGRGSCAVAAACFHCGKSRR